MSDIPKKDWGNEGHTCRETSGFLFSHPCEQIARYTCDQCGKPICNQHAIFVAGANLCIACSKRAPEDTDSPDNRPMLQDHHRPYWYATDYYVGYAYDDDFNDADEGVLVNGDNETKWEDDMGAS